MDRNGYHMDNSTRFDPLTLRDPQSGERSLAISGFDDAGAFAEPRQDPYFSILLINNGKGRAVRDGGTFEFAGPCLLCFSIYQPYSFAAEGRVDGVLLNFHPSFFCLFEHRHEVSCNGVLFNNLYDTPVVELTPETAGMLDTIVLQLRDELGSREQPDKDILLSFLKVFLINASRIKLEQQQADITGRVTPILADLTAAIEAHYKTHHQPRDYEALLHVTAAVLNKASKQFFRKTLTALIAERLIIEAKRQLYLTTKPVKEIAFELGYIDEFYFSRFFKKNVGVSPLLFREKVAYHRWWGPG